MNAFQLRVTTILISILGTLCLLLFQSLAAAHAQYPTSVTASGVASSPSNHGFPTGGSGPIQSSFKAALQYAQQKPGTAPLGVNDLSCSPQRGENPVILIPGTGEDAYATWAFYGPALQSEGICAYTFNHNPPSIEGHTLEWAAFSGDIRDSAHMLDSVVRRILDATDATKVDLVGHSQGGGPLAHFYIQNFSGEEKVNEVIGLTPSNHGTRKYELASLFEFYPFLRPPYESLTNFSNTQAWEQQVSGSSLLNDLSKNGLTRAPVSYVVITTQNDENVVPYTNSFIAEPRVENLTVEDFCGNTHSSHMNFTYDPIAFQLVLDRLKNRTQPTSCTANLGDFIQS